MVLSAGVLLDELVRFGDPTAPGFDGWTTSRDKARAEWGRAFAIYLGDMVDVAPAIVPTGKSLVFTAVEQAFADSITLADAFPPATARDFADAWLAAILALLPGLPATGPLGAPYQFEAMNVAAVTARHATLQADLLAAFTSPKVARRDDLEEIAKAFHKATSGLTSKPTTIVVTYG